MPNLRKIDNRIRVLIENSMIQGYRSMFVLVGERARNQIVILHHILRKSTLKPKQDVLWCYKNDLGFTYRRNRRMKILMKQSRHGNVLVKKDDPFEVFLASTNIRYCYYKDTHRILGNTYSVLVLQDFEAMTPNILARTIETIEGGGMVILLLSEITSLRQLYTMSMDVHARYRTDAQPDVACRFNERFILSMSSNPYCLAIDDKFQVLPLTSLALDIKPLPKPEGETKVDPLREIRDMLADVPVSPIVDLCQTKSQAQALLVMIDAIAEKSFRHTVTITAARGRGKSAALGLAIAAAIATGYANIFVTSPSPENLKTLFQFIIKGFDAMKYEEHTDYDIVQSTNPAYNKAVIRIVVRVEQHGHRQIVQYVEPKDYHAVSHAELLVIDEAAAIPLPQVKRLFGPYLMFLSSTINGYEGTGRSLSLKLFEQLRQQNASSSTSVTEKAGGATVAGRTLKELTLDESIRYKPGDAVEDWLNRLLCLDVNLIPARRSGCPSPDECQLLYVHRDTLFSYHKVSEMFLQQVVSIYVAAHYKNSPNDLQLLSDAPAHHLYVLLPPVDPSTAVLPEVFCVIQVCYEGGLSPKKVQEVSYSGGTQDFGDLIPWTVSEQYNDPNFAKLNGARIVRIATHPDYQRMGYGTRALQQLLDFFEGKMISLDELNEPKDISEFNVKSSDVVTTDDAIEPRRSLPPLLLKLSEIRPPTLDYVGVSFGVTGELVRFWKTNGFVPAYIRQTKNALTDEHSCIMLKAMSDNKWMPMIWNDFRKRFSMLLGYSLRTLPASVALSILTRSDDSEPQELTESDIRKEFSPYDMERLELYATRLVDWHLITDLLPSMANLYFVRRIKDFRLSTIQETILVALGFQRKTIEDDLVEEIGFERRQLLAFFNKTCRKLSAHFRSVVEASIGKTVEKPAECVELEVYHRPFNPLGAEDKEDGDDQMMPEDAKDEDDDAEEESSEKPLSGFLSQYAVKGSDNDWRAALKESGNPNFITIPTTIDRRIQPSGAGGNSVEQNKPSFKMEHPKKHKLDQLKKHKKDLKGGKMSYKMKKKRRN